MEITIPKNTEWLTVKIEGVQGIFNFAVDEIPHAIKLLEDEVQ